MSASMMALPCPHSAQIQTIAEAVVMSAPAAKSVNIVHASVMTGLPLALCPPTLITVALVATNVARIRNVLEVFVFAMMALHYPRSPPIQPIAVPVVIPVRLDKNAPVETASVMMGLL